jgi:putative ABC transport system permease protein
LKHFAVLKALERGTVVWSAWQGSRQLPIGFVGYSVGLFGAACFFEFAGRNPNFAGFFLPWQVGIGSGAVAAAIILLASLVALRRLLFVDPAGYVPRLMNVFIFQSLGTFEDQ